MSSDMDIGQSCTSHHILHTCLVSMFDRDRGRLLESKQTTRFQGSIGTSADDLVD